MAIKEARDVATILGVLHQSFRHGALHNGVIDDLILMDKPIAQSGALGKAQSKGHGEYACLRGFETRAGTPPGVYRHTPAYRGQEPKHA